MLPSQQYLLCCFQEKTTLLKRLIELKDLQISHTISGNDDLEEPLSVTGLETFSLSFKVCNKCFFYFFVVRHGSWSICSCKNHTITFSAGQLV